MQDMQNKSKKKKKTVGFFDFVLADLTLITLFVEMLNFL